MKTIFESYESLFFGQLKNRIAMTAMARGFAEKHCCTDLMHDYYFRRAKDGVGLILTEGLIIHPSGDGYNRTPHIWEHYQANSWKPLIKSAHDVNSKIVCQLWHCGRISHSDYTGGIRPVSSTNIAAEGINRQNNKPFSTPKRMSIEDINDVHDMYLHATGLALETGFDALELHLGHGYIADQFFDSRINDRKDEYGGSIENRCRFSIELIDKVIKKYGADRVIVRISPSREMDGSYDWPDLDDMLKYFIPALETLGLKILDVSCARADYFNTSGRVIRMIRKLWKHEIIGGASLSLEQANEEINLGLLDIVTWGRYLLANPDFVTKLRNGEKLNEFNQSLLSTLY
jgi:2,4-dienoyl-CoA reductase-like NADH-dependent reductase (Old Yellow Enzyme family)